MVPQQTTHTPSILLVLLMTPQYAISRQGQRRTRRRVLTLGTRHIRCCCRPSIILGVR